MSKNMVSTVPHDATQCTTTDLKNFIIKTLYIKIFINTYLVFIKLIH